MKKSQNKHGWTKKQKEIFKQEINADRNVSSLKIRQKKSCLGEPGQASVRKDFDF